MTTFHPATELLVACAYLAVCVVMLLRLPFFRAFGLPVTFLVAAFLLRCITGAIAFWMHLRLYGGGDALDYFTASQVVFGLLEQGRPDLYLRMVFGPNTVPPPEALKPYAFAVDFWNDNGAYLLIRFHALVRLIGFGAISAHIVWYNFLCLIGLLCFFKSLIGQLPDARRFLQLIFFAFPSVVFWTSNLLKEGAALAALGVVLYHGLRPVQEIRWKNLLPLVVGCGLLLLLRDFWLLLMLPAWLAWQWVAVAPRHVAVKYAAVVSATFLFSMGLYRLWLDEDPLILLQQKQEEFLRLQADSRIGAIPKLEGNWVSVFLQLPLAIGNSLMQPTPIQKFEIQYVLAFADNVLVLGILVCSLLWFLYCHKQHRAHWNLFWFCLTFSLLLLLLIGYTVPIAGAMVRYKTAATVFLLLAAASVLPAFRRQLLSCGEKGNRPVNK